jgi:phosphinothricin acetyltransferase
MVDIRDASEADLAAITAIYAYHTLHGTGTFALEPPTQDEMLARFREIKAMRLPYLVSLIDGAVAGFAYAAPFRTRPAYRYGVEDSVYVAPETIGKGHGRALLEALIAGCAKRGLYNMVAVIGDADNAGSIGVHAACGFEPTGHIPRAGFKFGRWLDVVFMSRDLRPPTDSPQGDGWAG